MRRSILFLVAVLLAAPAVADTLLLRPARVFDGVNPQPHEGWQILVEGDKIAAVGPNLSAPAGARDHRPSRHDPAPRHDRGPLAPVPPPVQRNQVGRSGAPRAAGAAHCPRRRPRRKDARRPASPPSATSAPRAPVMPTSGSSRRSTRGSSPARACWLRPRPMSRGAPTAPRDSSPASRSRRAPKRSAAPTR